MIQSPHKVSNLNLARKASLASFGIVHACFSQQALGRFLKIRDARLATVPDGTLSSCLSPISRLKASVPAGTELLKTLFNLLECFHA
jgi:hypothetical protein